MSWGGAARERRCELAERAAWQGVEAPLAGSTRWGRQPRGAPGEDVLVASLRGLGSFARCLRVAAALPVVLVSAAMLGGGASGAGRVVGGSAIQIQAAPWAVFVKNQTSSDFEYDCTGSVIDDLHILTAAHCVYDESGNLATPSQMSIEAGISNFSAPLGTDIEQQDRAVSSFTVHPGYTYSKLPGPDDVAVLALASPLDLSGPAVTAVALPTPGAAFPAGAAVGLAGFGEETPGGDPNGQLSWMTATVDPQGFCSPDGQEVLDYDAIRLCASSPSSVTCQGDSGSGLVTTGSTPTLVAVLSAGPPVCSVGSHTTFTYVGAPEIFDFIEGSAQPPTAPREDSSTYVNLDWDRPLVVGTTLTCSAGDWVGAGVSVIYSFVTATGQVLQTGTHTTYTLRPADLGAAVSCVAAGTNPGGTDVLQTLPTTPVKPAPQVSFGSLTPMTVVRGRTAIFLVRLKVPLGLSGSFGVCLRPSSRVGGPICRSLSNQQGGLGSGSFTLRLAIKATAPIGTTRLAVSGEAGVSHVTATVPLRITAAPR